MEAVVMRRVAPLSVVSVLALVAACTSSPGTVSTSTSGGTTVSPSATPTLATGVATPTLDPNLDATTHARVHVVALDHGGANVDVFVDGATANNGGQAQVNVHTGYVTAYLYLAPGTHRVAVVPTGTTPAQAGQAGVDVPGAAGHRYVVAFPAPITGGSAKPLVVDETDAAAHVGATPADSVYITLNGMAGTTGLDFTWAGKVINAGIKFGDFGTGIVPPGDAHITVTAKGTTDNLLIDEKNYSIPGNSVFGAFGTDATSSGSREVVDGAPTTEQNLVDSLHAYDAKKLLPGSSYPGGTFPSFTTVLAAIKTAGMTDLYTGGATLLFLPPTDRAFTVLPQAQRDALLADPAALAAMLRSHTIGAYVPRGSLATTPGGSLDRTFKNLNGETIKIGSDFGINGGSGGGESYWLANGTQIHPVNDVSFPPAS
jgi:uncharacterized surface protein with fasciclin (FAS1) repeats